MNRENRTAILEPIMLILKQRTGIATVIAMIVGAFMQSQGSSVEEIAMILSPIFVYVGKQGYIDSKESSAETTQKLEEFRDDVLDTVSFLIEGFDEKSEDEVLG